ncbi:hypothetical protein Plhal304r1_c065g0152671 [Plasmopara halstedii]
MSTIKLNAASEHVGQSVQFIAAVQQIATGKKVLVARQRVQACHVLYVGDASRQFFKVTCWGETKPTLLHSSSSSEDSNPLQLSSVDAMLQIGDIVFFSSCCIKSYRGNVEAQFVLCKDKSTTSSTVQLLYRKDRYFSTQNVSLKDLYPMISWYKQSCREFTFEEGVSPKGRRNKCLIKDLKDNMVACVVCKLRKFGDDAGRLTISEGGVATELDGVLLCELIMFDSPRDMMTLNLWDQHADKRFVDRLLRHRGAIEINGIVVSLQALSNRLFANTTPHTVFHLLKLEDLESIELENKIKNFEKPFPTEMIPSGSTTFATLDEIEGCLFEGKAILKNVQVEQICFDRFLGSKSSVLPKFAQQLVEMYCIGCNQALSKLPVCDSTIILRFGACASKCKSHQDNSLDAPCCWRYRPFSITLRDIRNERLQVEVNDQAIKELVGNIEAGVVAESYDSKDQEIILPHFDAAFAVASLLNALVDDVNYRYEAQLLCSTIASQPTESYKDTSHNEHPTIRRHFCLISLTSSDTYLI